MARVIRLDWSHLKHTKATPSRCEEVVDQYPTVFRVELWFIKGTLARFEVDAKAQSKFSCAHLVSQKEQLKRSNLIMNICTGGVLDIN